MIRIGASVLLLLGVAQQQQPPQPSHAPAIEMPPATIGKAKLPPPAKRLDYLSAAHLAQAGQRIRSGGAVGTTVLTSADQQTTYTLVTRTQPGEIEEHSRWDDIVIVRGGRGVVEFGPAVSGARVRAHGELRGGRFTAEPYKLHMRAGDVARIPAAVAHSFAPESGGAEPFEYLIVKVRRPNLPLKQQAGRR
jgi:mannose-6-phosphate isomerase-like protein (cupin superfamily)